MNWKLVWSTFGVIFLAELGDKTQLAAITLAATSQRPWSVLVGASAALVMVSTMGVLIGSALSEAIPLGLVRKLGAAAFVLIGLAMLFDKI